MRSRAMSSSSGAAMPVGLPSGGAAARTRCKASCICPSEMALLLPVLVVAGAGRGDAMEVAPGLADKHRRHLEQRHWLADPASLSRRALETEADEGAGEA